MSAAPKQRRQAIELKGRIADATGADRAFGDAYCGRLATDGVDLVVIDLDLKRGQGLRRRRTTAVRYAFAAVVAIAITVANQLCGAPTVLGDPTDGGIEHNPGLQVNCAFNPAFQKVHASACKDFDVEAVASNGGPA
jgi:hypothetical protein